MRLVTSKDIQRIEESKPTIGVEQDNYNIGLWNGIELVTAYLQKREPTLLKPYILRQEQEKDDIRVNKRTISGIVKRGAKHE